MLGQGLWLCCEKESITLGVTAAPPSLQRFYINNRCPMAVKGIGHMLLLTGLQLSAPPQQMKEYRHLSKHGKMVFLFFFLLLSQGLYNYLFFLYFVPFPPLLCPNFSFPLLIPGGTIKEHKVTGFVTREFSWNTKCAISSDTGWTLHHGIPGDHLKPVAFIRQSQGLFWWCKALSGALTWWRAEEAGGELDLAWIDAPNDEA